MVYLLKSTKVSRVPGVRRRTKDEGESGEVGRGSGVWWIFTYQMGVFYRCGRGSTL